MATRKKKPARSTTKTSTKKKPAARKAKKATKATRATAKKKTAKKAKTSTRKKPAPAAKTSAKKRSSGAVLKGLPILWSHRGAGQAVGLHIDDNEVWGGWETGDVVACDLDGNILRRWKLPAGVDALVADEVWRYAGCRDGNIYDLTSSRPRVAYEVDPNAHIQWVDVFRGNLCASDSKGACTVVDAEQNLMWKYTQPKGTSGWMVRADASGVYLGNSHGVFKFDWAGEQLWHTKTKWIGYGWPEGDNLYVFEGAWGRDAGVVAVDKATGKVLMSGSCWSDESHYHAQNSAASAAASAGGDRIFGGTCDTLFCYDPAGKLLWETPTRCGATCSMAFKDDRLYVVTHEGYLACLDVSPAAIAAAVDAAGAHQRSATLEDIAVTARDVEEATEAGAGVIVECIREGGKLRVRVVSAGYHADWYCQFPRDIREEGARYVVDEVREAAQGGFYRVLGEIRRLRG